MADIQQLIEKTIQTKFDSGTLEKVVDAHVNTLIEDAVKDALRSWSPFGKGLKEMLETKLTLNPESYNLMVLEVVQRLLDAHLQGHLKMQVEEGLKDILEPFDASKPIKMSELVRDFMESTSEYEDNMQGRITCHIEFGTLDGYWRFYLDKDEGTQKYQCDIQGAVNREGELYSLKISGEKVEKNLFLGPLYNFERRLFQLYANKAVLELDEHDIETGWDKF